MPRGELLRQTSTGVYVLQNSSGKDEMYYRTPGGEFVKQESIDRDRGKRHQVIEKATTQQDNHPLMVAGLQWDGLADNLEVEVFGDPVHPELDWEDLERVPITLGPIRGGDEGVGGDVASGRRVETGGGR